MPETNQGISSVDRAERQIQRLLSHQERLVELNELLIRRIAILSEDNLDQRGIGILLAIQGNIQGQIDTLGEDMDSLCQSHLELLHLVVETQRSRDPNNSFDLF